MKSQSVKIDVKANMAPLADQLDAAAVHLSSIADAYRAAANNLRAGVCLPLPIEPEEKP